MTAMGGERSADRLQGFGAELVLTAKPAASPLAWSPRSRSMYPWSMQEIRAADRAAGLFAHRAIAH